MRFLLPFLIVTLLGCGARAQANAIRDARLALAITGEATKAADLAAVEYFTEFPAEDTEHYCEGEITALVLEEVVSVLHGAADAVKLWETSLAVYMAKKDGSSETDADWSAVLSSEADWFVIAVDVVSVLDLAMRELEHAGVELPAVVSYAWQFLYSMTGRQSREPYAMTWGDLGGCAEYLRGGS